MVFDWQWIIGPVVGAIIGLITNGIAIRMLFRPLHPVKIGNFTLPFTPGLIPKEKPRIAHSIGQLVANQLVNAEVLEKGLINERIDNSITEFIDNFVNQYKDNPITVGEVLLKHFDSKTISYYTVLTENKIAEIAYQKALEMNLGEMAVDAIKKELERREAEDPYALSVMPMILSLLEQKIVETINQTVKEQGFFIISQFLGKEAKNLLSIPMSTIYDKSEKYIPSLNEKVLQFYHYCVLNYLPEVLQKIDLAKLVEDRINDFSLEELEKLLLELMRKELNAIVYLGGLLGALMGVVMIFV